MESNKINEYIDLLKAYNDHTNIYSATAYDHLDFHIENSLAICNLLPKGTVHVMDIGSGSGLPSIPIAIAAPAINVTAVESKSRKTKFLEQCKRHLHLRNYHVVTANITDHIIHNRPNPSVITAKAFAPVERFVPMLKILAYTGAKIIVPISENQIQKVSDYAYPNYVTSRKIETVTHHIYLTFYLKPPK